ncbi:hypothetical protein ANO11243_024100 [Dothideomycetidae sp. 11243]|nr:hypothetical protein ANO11243_024100 [fungal sp. No.11243]
MQLSEETLTLLRPYVAKQLESVSDAENDVLADYVIELIKSEGDEAAVQRNAKEQLSEFLDGGDVFVDQIFQAIHTKAYDPNAAHPIPSVASQQRSGNGLDAQDGGSKKRSFRDDDDVAMQDYGARGRDRPMKAARRGRGDHLYGRGGRGGGGGRGGFQQQQQQTPMSMPGFNFDPSADPMAAFMALQQAMLSNGMPFPQQDQQQKKTGKRCRDYDNKGVCMRGANCPYDHGNDFDVYNSSQQGEHYSSRGRGRGRGDRGRGGRGGRADFSSAGPNHDRNNTSVVVENIPDDSLNEDAVRAFFGDFGTIEDISLQEQRKLAVIRFLDHDTAQRAYDSPKVIFDNRFVKVYWYKSDSADASRGGAGDVDMSDETSDAPPIDLEAFNAQQAAAQERFESQKAARAAREELEAKIKAQAEEQAALRKRLAEKTKTGTETDGATAEAMSTNNTASSEKTAATEALKAKLAALEAEALSIGLNPNGPNQSFAPRGRGRGRGSFAPRGRGWHRGGGAMAAGGAVKRLDNRPRGVSVSFSGATDEDRKWDAGKEEALRQFLLFVQLQNNTIQYARVSAHPSRPDAALVVFTERFRAELFVTAVATAGGAVPHLGKVDVGWVANADVPSGAFPDAQKQGEDAAAVNGTWDQPGDEAQSQMQVEAPQGREEPRRGEVDYDVADDDSRWMVE